MTDKNAFEYESEIQSLLWQAIQDDTLSGCIVDDEEMRTFADPATEGGAFPQFSIDHLVRRACIRAGSLVLDSLTLLEPLTNDQNVSIASGEILRPDIVCVNPERESVVIFELKKATQTGRQAITELLAYEHEIKNLLPFLSNYDVHFVLVSPEWSTLMDHAVASAIAWSGRQILCLEAGLDDGNLRLSPRVPPAWTITGSVYFPEDALPCVTVCLYEKDAYSAENVAQGQMEKTEELDPRIWTALEVIAREGDRTGSHGFALLWRDHLSMSLTSYNLTVVGVSPFSFFRDSRLRDSIGNGTNELVRRLDDYLLNYDPTGHSASLTANVEAAFPLLKEVSDPSFEGFSTWSVDQHSLSQRAEPILCEFWGELGVYARAFVMHPAVRAHRPNMVGNGFRDWRDPRVGLPLISSFTKPQIFGDGDVRCLDAFRLGVLIGLDRMARVSIRNGATSKELECLFQWNRIELMAAIDEVRLLANAAKNVDAPEEPLKFYEDPLFDDDKSNEQFLKWLVQQFFQNETFHVRALEIGINGAFVFNNEREGIFRAKLGAKFIDPIADPIRRMTGQVLEYYLDLKKREEIPDSVQQAFRLLIKMLGLRANFAWKKFDTLPIQKLIGAFHYTLRALDAVIPSVFHEHAPLASVRLDWPWLKQGVSEMRKRGIEDAGVILLPNGQLVTGPVLPSDIRMPLKIANPEDEVPYLDRSNGIGLMRIMTWAELKTLLSKDDETATKPE